MMAVRMIIYPDSNAFFSDWRMTRQYSQDFLAVLAPGVVEVGLSPVVLAEIKRKATQEAETALSAFRKATRSLDRNWGSAPALADGELDRIGSALRAQSENALNSLIADLACRVLDWSDVTVRELVERELQGLRPAKLSGDQTIGFRDSVIWQTILDDAAVLDEDDIIVLVSKDGGFLSQTRTLHADLEADLRKRGLDPTRASVQPDLAGVTLEAQTFRKLLSDRDAEARDAFLDYVRSFTEKDWSSRTGDLDWSAVAFPNDFYNMDGVHVIAADIEDVESEVGADSVLCSVIVELTFEGSMEASEYFSGEYDVEWHGGEAGDPHLSVSTSRHVRFEADVRVTAEAIHLAFESIDWAPDY